MNPLPPPAHPYQFRALGLIKGSLKSIPETYAQATLVATDGVEYPATPGRAELLRPFTYCIESGHTYWYYVQPQPRSGGTLGLSVIRILALPEEEQDPDLEDEPFLPAPEDAEEGFNIRGIVEPHDGFIWVTVRRKPQGNKQFPPLQLRLEGFLPGAAAGEFWDLLAEREGHELLLVDGSRLLTAVA
ncbi:hypothetical protein NW841_05835 [Synechococcus sp. H60.3]|uniref:hypothetical protein n=1 Tax=unclassified Synechococcus TaxID=2626047 RepID=UPI0039C18CF0